MVEDQPIDRAAKSPTAQAWPKEGMEAVPHCPVCGAAERELLYSGLLDNTYFCAPGRWTCWRCGACKSAYLDPRPTRETIGLAYQHYYTHEGEGPPPPRGSPIRSMLGNGYRNGRYGADLKPASVLGNYIGKIPPFGWAIDSRYRYLPPTPGRVIDIGAGGGDWLELARTCGWQVAAVEPDPVARERIVSNEIEARPSAEAWFDQAGRFDAVTLNHVIEHVHDPHELLSAAFSLLKPGGQIFVETPNVDALAHGLYGRDWASLDPPRHLLLFNRKSLRQAMQSVGFRRIRFRRRPAPLPDICHESRRIAAGLDPFGGDNQPERSFSMSLLKLRSILQPSRSEYLTLTAIKE